MEELSAIQILYVGGTFKLLCETVTSMIGTVELARRQNRQNSNRRQRISGDDIHSSQNEGLSKSKRKHSDNAGADEEQDKSKKKRY